MAEFRFKVEIKNPKLQHEPEKITVLSKPLSGYDNTSNKFTIIITTDNTSWANRTKISSKPVLEELIILTIRCQELGIFSVPSSLIVTHTKNRSLNPLSPWVIFKQYDFFKPLWSIQKGKKKNPFLSRCLWPEAFLIQKGEKQFIFYYVIPQSSTWNKPLLCNFFTTF